MMPLSDAQKELLFDYSLGMTDPSDTAEAEGLLAASPEALELYELFRSALSPLESVDPEPCPDELVESTIQCLKEYAAAGQARLDQLLAAEQARVIPLHVPSWRNFGEVAAVAAILILAVGVLLPALSSARQKQWLRRCQSNLAGIYGGTASYMADHEDRLPTVPIADGSPYWKIGAQGPENHSNTRGAWLLVKQGYAQPIMFICAARRGDPRVDPGALDVTQYNDFPSPAYIHFSIRIDCPRSSSTTLGRKRVFLADRNPIFEEFPRDCSSSPSIELHKRLLTANSRNHRQQGQNILLCDGSVEFIKTRRTSFSDDDIYSLQAMTPGQRICGCERPSSDADTFVAP
jgi:hypothetical protein